MTPRRGPPGPIRHEGFTLIEMAVAVFIIALLLGSILVPLTAQVEQRQVADTQKALEEIKEALLGFAVANGHLPCPDKTGTGGLGAANDGVEDFSAFTGFCVTLDGNVPWATLGVANADPWGNRYRYRVVSAFAQRPAVPATTPPAPPLFTLSSTADLQVCSDKDCGTATLLTSGAPNGAVAVILSHGRNGHGAMNSFTFVGNPLPTSADELENTGVVASRFVSRPITSAGLATEFDDIVTWLSKHTLFNRMVASGKLP